MYLEMSCVDFTNLEYKKRQKIDLIIRISVVEIVCLVSCAYLVIKAHAILIGPGGAGH